MEQVFHENRNFFTLPEPEKRRILADENNRYMLFLHHSMICSHLRSVRALPSAMACICCQATCDPAHSMLARPR